MLILSQHLEALGKLSLSVESKENLELFIPALNLKIHFELSVVNQTLTKCYSVLMLAEIQDGMPVESRHV